MPEDPNAASDPQPEEGELPPDPFGEGDPFDTSSVTSSADHHTAGPTQSGPFGHSDDMFSGLGSVLGPMLGDLTKALAHQNQNAWSQAKTYAAIRAAGDATSSPGAAVGGSGGTAGRAANPPTDPPVDPMERIRLEELVGIVERHVTTYTGLELSDTGLKLSAHTRAGWSAAFLDTNRTLLESALNPKSAGPTDVAAGSPEAFLTNLMGAVGPSMMAMQIGAMAGQLAHRYFGSRDLPLPRQHPDRLTFIPSNIARFATEWSLPPDSLRVRVAIDELLLHGIVRQPRISQRLRAHIEQHASGFSIDSESLMQRFADLAGDPAAMQEQLADFAQSHAQETSPQQRAAAGALQSLNTVISGYIGHVGQRVASQLLGGDKRVDEALRRRRIEPDDATDMLARLTGLQITAEQHERGTAFVSGVLDRTGDSGATALNALWDDDANWPTDAELAAPGLWLARLELQA